MYNTKVIFGFQGMMSLVCFAIPSIYLSSFGRVHYFMLEAGFPDDLSTRAMSTGKYLISLIRKAIQN